MADFYIKRNDTSPSLRTTCERPPGTALDLTGATIRFHMRNSAGTTVVDEAATAVDLPNGIVEYQWIAADTETAGYFEAEFEVTYSDASIETFPNSEYISIKITEDVA